MTAALPERAQRWSGPRGWLSTILVSAFLSAFAGLLWIGRGRAATLLLLLEVVLALALVGAGIVLVVDGRLAVPLNTAGSLKSYWWLLSWVLSGLVSLAIVLPLRQSSRPRRWYARGYNVAWLWLVGLLLGSALPALGIRSFLFQSFSMPSSSMAPSLDEGDYFVVSKYAFGWGRYSLPLPLLPEQGIARAAPQRGDVVVFRVTSGEQSFDYVKRVIGLPGDRVQVVGGVVQLNGAPLAQEELGETTVGRDGAQKAKLLRETLPDGESYRIASIRDDAPGDNTQAWTVPPDALFVLGDNRDNSNDSRFQLGFVPVANLVGRAERIFWNAMEEPFAERADLRASR